MTNAHRRTPRTCFGQISQPNGPAIIDALSAMLAHAPVNDLDQWQEGERLRGIDVPATSVSPVARDARSQPPARGSSLVANPINTASCCPAKPNRPKRRGEAASPRIVAKPCRMPLRETPSASKRPRLVPSQDKSCLRPPREKAAFEGKQKAPPRKRDRP